VKLGIVQIDGRLVRGIAFGGLAMAAGAFGLIGVQPAPSRASAASIAGEVPPVVADPAAEPVTTTVTAEPTTTSTVAAEPSTTTTVPAPTTSTTTAPPPPPKPSAPPVRVAASKVSPQQRVEAIADESRWDWRRAGVRFSIGFYPPDCCHWGVYESPRSTVWIGPTAFDNEARLRYVVLHELAHAWQYHTGRFAQLMVDFETWGWSGIAPNLEAGADCIAMVWGATGGHYWSCPAAAQVVAARRLAGDWH